MRLKARSSDEKLRQRLRFLEHFREHSDDFIKWIAKLELKNGGQFDPNKCDTKFKEFLPILLEEMDPETFLVRPVISELAKRLGKHPNTIRNWLKLFEEFGILDYRRGKPVVLYMVGVARYWEAYSNGVSIQSIPITRLRYRDRLKAIRSKRNELTLEKKKEWIREHFVVSNRQNTDSYTLNSVSLQHIIKNRDFMNQRTRVEHKSESRASFALIAREPSARLFRNEVITENKSKINPGVLSFKSEPVTEKQNPKRFWRDLLLPLIMQRKDDQFFDETNTAGDGAKLGAEMVCRGLGVMPILEARDRRGQKVNFNTKRFPGAAAKPGYGITVCRVP